jgi:ribonuclease HI
MTQLDLFPKKKTTVAEINNKWQLYVDGASRNNPGLAGAGIFVKKNNQEFLKESFFLNLKTNNEAEYLALIFGLLIIEKYIDKDDSLEIASDSELLVKQITYEYRVKKPELKKFFDLVQNILKKLNFKIKHILRDQNQEADKLANEAIDKRSSIPQDLLLKVKSYGINI